MTERFSPLVAQTLEAGGWRPGHRDDERAREWAVQVAAYVAPSGLRHTVVPPALDVYAEFGDVAAQPPGPGEQFAPSHFVIAPLRVYQAVQVTVMFAQALGVPVTPIGEENEGAGILVIDAAGRVFVIDHTAEWLLGATFDHAVESLVRGLAPARVRSDGTW